MAPKAALEARKLEAEAAKLEAEAAKERQETKRISAEAKKALAYAKKAELELLREEEKRLEQEHSDEAYRLYLFTKPVSEGSVGECMAKLSLWSRIDPKCPIEIVFTSPGGSVLHGMALFDFLRALSKLGHEITTTDLGYSASMAGILLQAGDIRRMGAESYFHIHEISTGAIGKLTELEDEVEFCKKITKRVVDIFVSRSSGKLTATKLRRMFERKEAWFDSAEALKYGLVDEVL